MHVSVMKRLLGHLLKGLGLGLVVATGLSAWVLLVRIQAGSAPFDRLHTTFAATVAAYYEGGTAGGLLIGLAWPLRRWLFGYALLGVLGVFPLYLFGANGPVLSSENVAAALLGAFFVGGAVGVWAWAEDHSHGPSWFDTLRFPTAKTTVRVWGGALFIAILSFVLVPRWSFDWPGDMVLFAAALLFIVPLMTAALVTMRFYRVRRER